MSRFRWVFILVAILAAAGCATAPAPKTPTSEDLWAEYARAVEAARIPVQANVSTRLTAILETNPELRWNQERVLMATWTKKKYYEGKVGQPYTLPQGVTVWLTAVPYLQKECRGWGLPPERLSLRLAQELGMPPPSAGGNDSFVQMWVDPKTFFRPCPDPEITDHECLVNVDGGPANATGGCPWSTDQVSGAFVDISDAHLTWMCDNWTNTYTGDPKTSYPWTALGYTFDWSDFNHPQGQSEYVVPPGTTVWIESLTPTGEYCKKGN
jgi:hypothetical protein